MEESKEEEKIISNKKRKIEESHDDQDDKKIKGEWIENPSKDPQQQQQVLINSDGESYFKLSGSKRLTVRKWKSQILIDIREFYQDKAGEWKPGKKGISLTLEQYQALKDCMVAVPTHTTTDHENCKLSLVEQVIESLGK
jgi:hypothetical protein